MTKRGENRLLTFAIVIWILAVTVALTDTRYRLKELEHRVDALVEFNIERLAGIESKTEYLIDRVLNNEVEKEKRLIVRSYITAVPRAGN